MPAKKIDDELMAFLKPHGIKFELPPLVKQAQEAGIQKLLEEFQSPAFLKAFETIQQPWKMPLAIDAFANSLGISHRLPKIPALQFPELNLPKFNFDIFDWEAMYERNEQALRKAAKHNWFIQPETTSTFAVDIQDCVRDASQINELFMEMTNGLKNEIRTRLVNDHPDRAPIIDEMFRLHDEGRYFASIPLAMICAEGIAQHESNASIFNTNNSVPQIAKWIEKQDLPRLAKAFLSSLAEPHPMSRPRPGELNRHAVLHGSDTQYGTEMFSLQAISLLGFVGWAFAADGLVKREPGNQDE